MEHKGLSLAKRMALSLLDNLRQQVLNDCDDEEVSEALSKFHPRVNGYYCQEELVNADKAMDILHLGHNRTRFFALTKKYGVKNHKLSGQHIGFLRRDIEALKDKV